MRSSVRVLLPCTCAMALIGPPHDPLMISTQHGRAKLGEHSVRCIRGSSLTTVELATIFEVNPKVIANVRDGTTWKHVSDSAT